MLHFLAIKQLLKSRRYEKTVRDVSDCLLSNMIVPSRKKQVVNQLYGGRCKIARTRKTNPANFNDFLDKYWFITSDLANPFF